MKKTCKKCDRGYNMLFYNIYYKNWEYCCASPKCQLQQRETSIKLLLHDRRKLKRKTNINNALNIQIEKLNKTLSELCIIDDTCVDRIHGFESDQRSEQRPYKKIKLGV